MGGAGFSDIMAQFLPFYDAKGRKESFLISGGTGHTKPFLKPQILPSTQFPALPIVST